MFRNLALQSNYQQGNLKVWPLIMSSDKIPLPKMWMNYLANPARNSIVIKY